MDKEIYPITVSNESVQRLFDIMHKYQDTILSMAKVVGGDAAVEYNEAVEIINSLFGKVEDAVSPPKCIAKACLNSSYCHNPNQCDFVKNMKLGFPVARVNESEKPLFESIGWEVVSVDKMLPSTAKKYVMIYKK
jgi:hypothetical protein